MRANGKKALMGLAAAGLLLATPGLSGDKRPDDKASLGPFEPAREFRIGPEDVLQVTVWKNEAVSGPVTVRPDGKISIPLVNDVQAAGLTPLELRDVLMKRLAEFIPQPEVSVIVNEVRSYKVSVLGQVTRPGRFELRSWATVADVLAMAGGLTEYASRSNISVLRTEGGVLWRIPFDYDRLGRLGEKANFYVRAGDIVVVP